MPIRYIFPLYVLAFVGYWYYLNTPKSDVNNKIKAREYAVYYLKYINSDFDKSSSPSKNNLLQKDIYGVIFDAGLDNDVIYVRSAGPDCNFSTNDDQKFYFEINELGTPPTTP